MGELSDEPTSVAKVRGGFLDGVRWSRFIGQVVKLGSPIEDKPDDGQAEALFG